MWVQEYLLQFYRNHNPDKVSDVLTICQKYRGKEKSMLRQLHKKYAVAIPDDVRVRLSAPETEDTNYQPTASKESNRSTSSSLNTIDSSTNASNGNKLHKRISFRGRRMSLAAGKAKDFFLQGMKDMSFNQFSRGDIIIEGYLSKRSDWVRAWNTRWFTLKGNLLLYFDHADAHARGQTPRKTLRLSHTTRIFGCKEEKCALLIQDPSRETIWLKANDEEQHTDWVDALLRTIQIIKLLRQSRTDKRRSNSKAIARLSSSKLSEGGPSQQEMQPRDTDEFLYKTSESSRGMGLENVSIDMHEAEVINLENKDSVDGIANKRPSLQKDYTAESSLGLAHLNLVSQNRSLLRLNSATGTNENIDEDSVRWGIDAHVESLLMTPTETESIKLSTFLSQWRRRNFWYNGSESDPDLMMTSLKSCVADIHDHLFDVVWKNRYQDEKTYTQVSSLISFPHSLNNLERMMMMMMMMK